jgi:hypothetical protein
LAAGGGVGRVFSFSAGFPVDFLTISIAELIPLDNCCNTSSRRWASAAFIWNFKVANSLVFYSS